MARLLKLASGTWYNPEKVTSIRATKAKEEKDDLRIFVEVDMDNGSTYRSRRITDEALANLVLDALKMAGEPGFRNVEDLERSLGMAQFRHIK